MNNRIVEKMSELRTRGGKSFSIVLMIGDPDTTTTDELVKLALESNIDIVELGIPYQNPSLDSQVMRESMQRALAFSNDLSKYLDYLKHIRALYPHTPFEVMIYHETVMEIGLKRFAECLKEAQMDAVLVADYVLKSEAFLQELDLSLSNTGVIPIRFVPHPFNPDQVHDLKENGRGFIISQTITDDTGERKGVLDKNKEKLDFIRNNGIKTPLVLAYGIKTPEDVRKCVDLGADGVLLGTVILDAAHNIPLDDLRKLFYSLRSAAL